MKKCKSCQKEIDAKATKCPYCQTDQRNWFIRHPIWTVLLVLFIIGIIGAAGGNKNSTKPTASSSNNQESSGSVQETPIVAEEVDGAAFMKEFDTNQLAAEKKYKDKRVKLTAKIQNISEDIAGSPFLSLEPATSEDFYTGATTKCTFGSKDELTSLANKQTITVEGTVEDQSLGIIGMKDCKIVK